MIPILLLMSNTPDPPRVCPPDPPAITRRLSAIESRLEKLEKLLTPVAPVVETVAPTYYYYSTPQSCPTGTCNTYRR